MSHLKLFLCFICHIKVPHTKYKCSCIKTLQSVTLIITFSRISWPIIVSLKTQPKKLANEHSSMFMLLQYILLRYLFSDYLQTLFQVYFRGSSKKMINSKIKTMEKTGHFILFFITDKLKVSFIPSFFENALEVLSFPEIMEKLCLENKHS